MSTDGEMEMAKRKAGGFQAEPVQVVSPRVAAAGAQAQGIADGLPQGPAQSAAVGRAGAQAQPITNAAPTGPASTTYDARVKARAAAAAADPARAARIGAMQAGGVGALNETVAAQTGANPATGRTSIGAQPAQAPVSERPAPYKAGRALGEAGPPAAIGTLAALPAIAGGAEEDSTERYAQRFGVEPPTGDESAGDLAKFAALRIGGAGSDIAQGLLSIPDAGIGAYNSVVKAFGYDDATLRPFNSMLFRDVGAADPNIYGSDSPEARAAIEKEKRIAAGVAPPAGVHSAAPAQVRGDAAGSVGAAPPRAGSAGQRDYMSWRRPTLAFQGDGRSGKANAALPGQVALSEKRTLPDGTVVGGRELPGKPLVGADGSVVYDQAWADKNKALLDQYAGKNVLPSGSTAPGVAQAMVSGQTPALGGLARPPQGFTAEDRARQLEGLNDMGNAYRAGNAADYARTRQGSPAAPAVLPGQSQQFSGTGSGAGAGGAAKGIIDGINSRRDSDQNDYRNRATVADMERRGTAGEASKNLNNLRDEFDSAIFRGERRKAGIIAQAMQAEAGIIGGYKPQATDTRGANQAFSPTDPAQEALLLAQTAQENLQNDRQGRINELMRTFLNDPNGEAGKAALAAMQDLDGKPEQVYPVDVPLGEQDQYGQIPMGKGLAKGGSGELVYNPKDQMSQQQEQLPPELAGRLPDGSVATGRPGIWRTPDGKLIDIGK